MHKILHDLSEEVSHPRAVLLIVMLTMLLLGMAVGRVFSSGHSCERGETHATDTKPE